jgi:hypothetical protein
MNEKQNVIKENSSVGNWDVDVRTGEHREVVDDSPATVWVENSIGQTDWSETEIRIDKKVKDNVARILATPTSNSAKKRLKLTGFGKGAILVASILLTTSLVVANIDRVINSYSSENKLTIKVTDSVDNNINKGATIPIEVDTFHTPQTRFFPETDGTIFLAPDGNYWESEAEYHEYIEAIEKDAGNEELGKSNEEILNTDNDNSLEGDFHRR